MASKCKVKLSLYKSFCKDIELHVLGDPGTRLMFKFRSGTNGLNEDIGVKIVIGSVSYVGMNVRVWYMCSARECPVYDSIRNAFIRELDKLLGGGGGEF